VIGISTSELEESVFKAAKNIVSAAAVYLPDDVKNALQKALEKEENPLARKQFEAILENVRLAAELKKPICQDTGMVYFYAKVGEHFPILSKLPEILVKATRQATVEVPLRPNAVDPIRNKNSGDNTGRYMPWIDWEIVEGDRLELWVVLKGGGSEYPSTLAMISPALGLKAVKKVVVDAVYNAGPKPCPPVIVSVGLAGGSDIAMKLAKRSLLRPIGERHPDPEVAALEEELLGLINKLGIGVHGFGGLTTALDVKVEYGHRHPASFAVAVAFNCWATRRSGVIVERDGSIQYLTHKFLNKEVSTHG